MQNFFRRLIILVAMLLILIGIFGLSYTYQIDHRTARSLSAYARIDFQASYTGEGRLEGATLSLWDSFVLGGDISFRAGGVGIWRGSELGAEGKITPLVKNAKKPPYIVTRTDGSDAKMLCGMDSGVWQKGGDVRGFSAVSFTQTPPIVPVER